MSTNTTPTNNTVPFPWQQEQWQACIDQIEGQRFPHALLLGGQLGIGKRHFAFSLAKYLLCQQPVSNLPCGHCRSCQLNQAHTHPDFTHVGLVDKAKQIKIDQIRQLSSLVETAQLGGRKVIILEPLELLNVNAANALLKNLEEPPANTHFILVSNVLSQVMATIKSRCQLLSFPVPAYSQALAWLTDQGYETAESCLGFMGGAPLMAREMLRDDKQEALCAFLESLLTLQSSSEVDIGLVKAWQELELLQVLDWWLRLINRLMSGYGKQTPGAKSRFMRLLSEHDQGYKDLSQQWLFRFFDKLLNAKRQSLQGANPNKQLLFEELLLDWWAIIKVSR